MSGYVGGEWSPGARVELPGVRLTMWLAGLIIMVAGGLATWSLRSGATRPADLAAPPPGDEPAAESEQ